MKKVIIFDRLLLQYREEFFNGLRNELLKRGIELSLIYGKSKSNLSKKKDEIDIEWAEYIPFKSLEIGSHELIWQPYLNKIKEADLIIIEHANRLLINYILSFGKPFYSAKLAYWGHISNMQINSTSLRNKFKDIFTNRCDWWFTYTSGAKKELTKRNYPVTNITVVQNAIDTNELSTSYNSISELEISNLKSQLNIVGENIAVYCGGMYKEKRLEFLIEACKLIKKEIDDFSMLFIGAGEDDHIVKRAAKNNPWIKYLGPLFGIEKVKIFKLASIQLMPGLVGLGILDSFALETPILTTNYTYHSPEIEYLIPGKNGLMSEDDVEAFSLLTIDTLRGKKYVELIEGCKQSSKVYTVEKMVDNFASGVEKCLSS